MFVRDINDLLILAYQHGYGEMRMFMYSDTEQY